MAQAVNIVLADAKATPVNHTFIPLGRQGSWDMVFEDQSQSSPVGYWRIYVRQKRPTGKIAGSNIVTTISLQEPVLETIAAAASGMTQPPTVAYVPRCDLEVRISDRSSLEERKTLRKMLTGLLGEAQVTALIETLTPIY